MTEKNLTPENFSVIIQDEDSLSETTISPNLLRAILVVEHVDPSFGKKQKHKPHSTKEIGIDEKILLTLIAHIIVEIIIKEEL